MKCIAYVSVCAQMQKRWNSEICYVVFQNDKLNSCKKQKGRVYEMKHVKSNGFALVCFVLTQCKNTLINKKKCHAYTNPKISKYTVYHIRENRVSTKQF